MEILHFFFAFTIPLNQPTNKNGTTKEKNSLGTQLVPCVTLQYVHIKYMAKINSNIVERF